MILNVCTFLSILIHSSLFLGLYLYLKSSPINIEPKIFGTIDKVSIVEFTPTVDESVIMSGKDFKKKVKKRKKIIKKVKPGKFGSKNGAEVSARKRYFYELRAFLQQEAFDQYPISAARMRLKGTVVIEVRVDGKGYFSAVNLQKPSRYKIFNESAKELIISLARFKPFPSSMKELFVNIEIPLRYERE